MEVRTRMLGTLAQRKKDMDRAWLEGYLEGLEEGRRERYIIGCEEAIRDLEKRGVVLPRKIQAQKVLLKTLRACRQKILLQIITARSWQAARYDAARLA